MLKSRFVSRLYWGLVFLICATVLVLAGEVGVFGPQAQHMAKYLSQPVIEFYDANRNALDRAFVVIGSSIAAVTGGLAILKGFFYAEMNLPRRAQELIDEARERHLHARPDLLAYVRGSSFKTRDFLTPSFFANPFALMLLIFGWSSVRTQAREVATSVPRLTAELEALQAWKDHTENRKFTAHLLRGLCLAAQAREQPNEAYEHRKCRVEALKEFEAALSLRANDMDALEGATEQAATLGETSKQLAFLNGIVEAAEGGANRLRRATAQRQSALLMNNDPDERKKSSARKRLHDLTQFLDAERPDERLELAETLLALGIIQGRRGRKPTARRLLRRAKPLFGSGEGADRTQRELELLDTTEPSDRTAQ